ncbi:MAG: Uma2 family endonuclease [Bacteroidota bacterium]|nr:Uma2 family endonuclease [Bacteroidota bacterium]
MGQPELQPHHYTAEEYFALEAQSDVRHEFFEGEVFAMAGESIAHNTIAQNFVLALRPALRGKTCRVQMEGIQLAVEANRHYTYPDIVVSCDPDDQRESRRLHHPLLIVEVLSPSTEAYDRGLKFNQYKKLTSLRHYLLVSQKTWLVEWYQLSEHGLWGHTALAEAADAVVIPELNLTLTLVQIYEEAGVVPMAAGFLGEAE